MSDINDDIQNTGDQLRDRDLFALMSGLAGLPSPQDADNADYGFPIPYPPRKEDIC